MNTDKLIELYHKVDYLYDDLHTIMYENNNKRVTIIELLSKDITSNVIMMIKDIKDNDKIVTIEQLDTFKESLIKLDASVKMLDINVKYKYKITSVISDILDIIKLYKKALSISKFTFNILDAEGKMSNRSKLVTTILIFTVLVATQYIN